MLERIKKIIERIDGLTIRERAVIMGALLTVLFLGWYAYLIEPLKIQEKSLRSELDRKHSELKMLNDQFTVMSEKQRLDPGADARARLKKLRDEQKQLAVELQSATASLVAPQLMPEVLRSMLKSSQGLTLISMRGLGSAPLLKPAVEEKPAGGTQPAAKAPDAGFIDDAYKHGMQLEFSGDFFATLAFLRRLEALEWKFFWESVIFDVQDYPRAVATVRVFTLSLDKNWIGT